jgi:uncharacterized protein YecT (DUF1311 family)
MKYLTSRLILLGTLVLSLAFITTAQTKFANKIHSLIADKTACKQTSLFQRLQCIRQNRLSLDKRMKKLEQLALGQIDNYPGEGEAKNERDMEVISWFKDGLIESRNAWHDFRTAECGLFGAFGKRSNPALLTEQCRIALTKARIRSFYRAYLLLPEEAEELSFYNPILPYHPCDNTVSGTTLDIVDCGVKKLERSAARMSKILAKIKLKISSTDFANLSNAQTAWERYIDTYYNSTSLYETAGGTAGESIALLHKTEETELRIRFLKRHFLNQK